MDIKKAILYVIVAILAIMLFNTWVHDHPSVKHPKGNIETSTEDYTPPTYTPNSAKAQTTFSLHEKDNRRLVKIKTDVLELLIDTHGGNIVSAKLAKYPISLKNKNPVQILSNATDHLYIAEIGLTNLKTPIQYISQKNQYKLQDNKNKLVVKFTGKTQSGLHVAKVYTFYRNEYRVNISYQIDNTTNKPWEGSLYTQIVRRQPPAESRHFYVRSYNGAAISSPQVPYKKVTYEEMNREDVDQTSKNGWVAMQQHYFLSAWIPGNPDLKYHYYTRVIPSKTGHSLYVIGIVSPKMSLGPGEKTTKYSTFYVGPEIAKRLKALASGLDRTIDYGWLWPISTLLFWIMSAIHAVVKNWGWTIVLTTVLIKVVFYWFSATSFRSMARMREIQPRLQALKERYANDRQALSRATMDLYRKEKINPLGGCLPMLIQIPVFIAFYYVIIESVELRQAPFVLWIYDLSIKDPYYILPVLMGLSMLAHQWLSPTSPDPAQQKVMWILPIVFTVFFINFPAGLVLYWLTNNLVQTFQQWYVNKTYETHKAKLKNKKGKK